MMKKGILACDERKEQFTRAWAIVSSWRLTSLIGMTSKRLLMKWFSIWAGPPLLVSSSDSDAEAYPRPLGLESDSDESDSDENDLLVDLIHRHSSTMQAALQHTSLTLMIKSPGRTSRRVPAQISGSLPTVHAVSNTSNVKH